MSLQTDARDSQLRTRLRRRWNAFARTPSGDVLATLLTIMVMFSAMFGCACAVVLGTDGLELLFRPH